MIKMKKKLIFKILDMGGDYHIFDLIVKKVRELKSIYRLLRRVE